MSALATTGNAGNNGSPEEGTNTNFSNVGAGAEPETVSIEEPTNESLGTDHGDNNSDGNPIQESPDLLGASFFSGKDRGIFDNFEVIAGTSGVMITILLSCCLICRCCGCPRCLTKAALKRKKRRSRKKYDPNNGHVASIGIATEPDQIDCKLDHVRVEVSNGSTTDSTATSQVTCDLSYTDNSASTDPELRREFTHLIFDQLDAQSQGVLHMNDVRKFAEAFGFEGDDNDWAAEFTSLCRHLGCRTDIGIDPRSFAELVSDDTIQGCFCTDGDLEWLHGTLGYSL